MIAWTVEAAVHAKQVDRTFLSTDSEEIAAIGRQFGAEVPFLRPAHLATDTASSQSVVMHFVSWCREAGIEPDYIVLLQPTSPLRISADIDNAVTQMLRDTPSAVISVTPLLQHMALPWNLRHITDHGLLADYFPKDAAVNRTAERPVPYVLNGAVYVYPTHCLEAWGRNALLDVRPYVMPPERSIDVDVEFEFRLAELLLSQSA